MKQNRQIQKCPTLREYLAQYHTKSRIKNCCSEQTSNVCKINPIQQAQLIARIDQKVQQIKNTLNVRLLQSLSNQSHQQAPKRVTHELNKQQRIQIYSIVCDQLQQLKQLYRSGISKVYMTMYNYMEQNRNKQLEQTMRSRYSKRSRKQCKTSHYMSNCHLNTNTQALDKLSKEEKKPIYGNILHTSNSNINILLQTTTYIKTNKGQDQNRKLFQSRTEPKFDNLNKKQQSFFEDKEPISTINQPTKFQDGGVYKDRVKQNHRIKFQPDISILRTKDTNKNINDKNKLQKSPKTEGILLKRSESSKEKKNKKIVFCLPQSQQAVSQSFDDNLCDSKASSELFVPR